MPDAERSAYAVTDAHRLDVAGVVSAMGTDLDRGLSATEVTARRAAVGPNALASAPPTPAWRRFAAQFKDALVVLLLVATAVSVVAWWYEGRQGLPYEAMAIFAIVVLNATMGFIQEARAEAAVGALKAMSADVATVVRDGQRQRVAATELVPGDVLLVEEGDTIPADGRVARSSALHAAEAALTGESLPVAKDVVPLAADAALGDRVNMVFNGTAATRGHGTVVVTATGMATEMGRIAGMLSEAPAESTPLQRELYRTGRLLGIVVIVIAVVMIGTTIIVEDIHAPSALLDVLILGVALAVAAVPEGLPAIVTAVLSLGVQRMAKRKAIVRRLAAVETLGAASVVASDKTGTLTRNEMTVRAVVVASGRVVFTGSGYAPDGEALRDGGGPIDGALRAELDQALVAGDRASNATIVERSGRWLVQGDPMEGALVAAARKAGIQASALGERFRRVGEIPFTSERKLMTTVYRDRDHESHLVVFSKGAPDLLLARCSRELIGEETRPLTRERRLEIQRATDALADEALRTLGVAFRRLPASSAGSTADPALEEDLVFAGIIGMIDPPREEARSAVERARRAGVRPIMITGDHPRTAAVIARELGIGDDSGTITGAELDGKTDEELAELVDRVSVYARVVPKHKLRIVKALQRQGAIVAMTGDGVNDAPALKTADIGVAMGITGTDVAKEAADIILADDNFATIVAAVEEGRAIFGNIRKFLRYLLSSNIGEVLTMFFGVLLAAPLGLPSQPGTIMLPLLATQVLWINLVTDGAPALALGIDPTGADAMTRPPRPRAERVITGRMWASVLIVGATMAAATLFALDLSLPRGLVDSPGNIAHARTMAFTTLVLAQLVNVFNARSDHHSAFRHLLVNRWLWLAVFVSLALQAVVVYVPVMQRAFGTVALDAGDWGRCALMASAVLVVSEAVKAVRRLKTTSAGERAKNS